MAEPGQGPLQHEAEGRLVVGRPGGDDGQGARLDGPEVVREAGPLVRPGQPHDLAGAALVEVGPEDTESLL